MKHINSSGFSHILLILIVTAVLAITGLAGWRVIDAHKAANIKPVAGNNKKQTAKTDDYFEAQNKAAKQAYAEQQEKAKPLALTADDIAAGMIYKNKFLTVYDLNVLAITADQKAIAAVVTQACQVPYAGSDPADRSQMVAVYGAKDAFTNQTAYKKDGNFARLSGGCFERNDTKPEPGDGGGVWILQKQGSTWVVLESENGGVRCSKVDGTGVPISIVDRCYEDNADPSKPSVDRAPR